MRKSISLVFSVLLPLVSLAQPADTTSAPTLLTLEDALRIALSENASVQVADQEIDLIKTECIKPPYRSGLES